jgi:hypothetical protein
MRTPRVWDSNDARSALQPHSDPYWTDGLRLVMWLHEPVSYHQVKEVR